MPNGGHLILDSVVFLPPSLAPALSISDIVGFLRFFLSFSVQNIGACFIPLRCTTGPTLVNWWLDIGLVIQPNLVMISIVSDYRYSLVLKPTYGNVEMHHSLLQLGK